MPMTDEDALNACITYVVHGDADFSGMPEGLCQYFKSKVAALRSSQNKTMIPLTREQVFASDQLMAFNGSTLGLSMRDLMEFIRIVETLHGPGQEGERS